MCKQHEKNQMLVAEGNSRKNFFLVVSRGEMYDFPSIVLAPQVATWTLQRQENIIRS